MHIVSTGTQLCDKCGKPMANSRVANSQGTFHTECAGLGPFARIRELEGVLNLVLDKYDEEFPARTADFHSLGCECLRCHIDGARATLNAK